VIFFGQEESALFAILFADVGKNGREWISALKPCKMRITWKSNEWIRVTFILGWWPWRKGVSTVVASAKKKNPITFPWVFPAAPGPGPRALGNRGSGERSCDDRRAHELGSLFHGVLSDETKTAKKISDCLKNFTNLNKKGVTNVE